ncbi:secretion protein HlyD [bacterium]|nr:secretion protein HlyD [bacterium]
MSFRPSLLRLSAGWQWAIGLLVVVGIAGALSKHWWPATQAWVQAAISRQKKPTLLDEHDHGSSGGEHDMHDHGDHGHEHDEASSLELSQQALSNIGLTADYLKPLQLETFKRTISVPAIVVERPGRSRLEVSTPMAGVITHVHAVRGESVQPGSLLFELRITADELVSTQTELLKTIGDLDVEQREIARLEIVTQSGAVSQKTLLERQYAKDKLEVLLSAQKEALRLQGVSERQINDIVQQRKLLRDLKIVAPSPDDHNHDDWHLSSIAVRPASFSKEDHHAEKPEPADGTRQELTPLILEEVLVHKGETVAAGTTLGITTDMSELYIEGRAFEQDIDLITAAATQNWKVSAAFERSGKQTEIVPDLELLYSASGIDLDSRTLRFYVRLPNQIVRSVPSPNGLKFVEWKYRPGQRLQLRVPVEEWSRQIVLPVEAIAQEGAESFLFQQNGTHFDRIPVHVIYRDQSYVVIKNDGSIFPGDVVAWRGAHQMQMALKNKSGGGVDPHAGHNH